jgi:hypothetical protein
MDFILPCANESIVNMLYLDQPVQVGFSYDNLTNVTVSSFTDSEGVEVADFSNGSIPEQNNTFYVGTYPSQNANLTTQGSENSARALWHFAQVWFQEFPGYRPNDSRISIATESYGGRYGPAFAAYFQEQNERIENGTWDEVGQTHILHLDTLLIINGCVDRLVQWPGYPMVSNVLVRTTHGGVTRCVEVKDKGRPSTWHYVLRQLWIRCPQDTVPTVSDFDASCIPTVGACHTLLMS